MPDQKNARANDQVYMDSRQESLNILQTFGNTKKMFLTVSINSVRLLIFRSLEATLNELRQYKRQHDEWAALLNKILAEQASLESRIESRRVYEEFRMRQSKTGKGKAI